VILQPFWLAYLTAGGDRQGDEIENRPDAGIGSDHVDLQAAIDHGITVWKSHTASQSASPNTP
jgi:formate dehydrogenase